MSAYSRGGLLQWKEGEEIFFLNTTSVERWG